MQEISVVTDHEALVSLLNGNYKKNKTMFSRLTRLLDRLIPVDFRLIHKPGRKLGWRINEATSIGTCDKLFTVAKIISIRTNLGFFKNSVSRGPNLHNNTSKGPNVTIANHLLIKNKTCKISSRNTPVEGVKSCERKWSNLKQEKCINRLLRNTNENLVGDITQSKRSYSKNLDSNI